MDLVDLIRIYFHDPQLFSLVTGEVCNSIHAKKNPEKGKIRYNGLEHH
jgi:hypothetical protein